MFGYRRRAENPRFWPEKMELLPALMEIRIIRSRKRRKTVQARKIDGVLEILAPAHMSDKQLEPIIEDLTARINRQKKLSKLDDQALEMRANVLNRQYFDNLLQWKSICWVANQNTRHGSCNTGRGTIRISHRIAEMPQFVQDYVIVHELAHVLEPNHGQQFWDLVYRYPKTERARGYLMAVGIEDRNEE
jgi:predicted metal-dependent hydrolase